MVLFTLPIITPKCIDYNKQLSVLTGSVDWKGISISDTHITVIFSCYSSIDYPDIIFYLCLTYERNMIKYGIIFWVAR